jgi:hypothetical protein
LTKFGGLRYTIEAIRKNPQNNEFSTPIDWSRFDPLEPLYPRGKFFLQPRLHQYFWRGIAADASILILTMGVLMFVLLPRNSKTWGLLPVVLAIVLVITRGRAVLQAYGNYFYLYFFYLSCH